jgi:hypothetical protein
MTTKVFRVAIAELEVCFHLKNGQPESPWAGITVSVNLSEGNRWEQ